MGLSCPDSDVLSAHPGMPLFFLAREDGALTGALALFDPQPHEIEVTALVRPDRRRQGLFTALWKCARQAAAPFRPERALFCVDPACPSGEAVRRRFPLSLDHSESTLVYDRSTVLPAVESGLVLRPAGEADLPALTEIAAAAFGDPPEEAAHILASFREDAHSAVFAACLEGAPVGQIVLRQQEDALYLCSLCIRPDRQGRGLGRDMLTLALNQALGRWGGLICLDVDLENAAALGLYTGLGFREERRCDYYALPL